MENNLKTELSENDDVTRWWCDFPAQNFPPTLNIWYVLRVKTPFSNFSAVVWWVPQKNKFPELDLTCWRSMKLLCLRFLNALNTRFLTHLWLKVDSSHFENSPLLSNILDLKRYLSNKWKFHLTTDCHFTCQNGKRWWAFFTVNVTP